MLRRHKELQVPCSPGIRELRCSAAYVVTVKTGRIHLGKMPVVFRVALPAAHRSYAVARLLTTSLLRHTTANLMST